ncbi:MULTISPECIES: DUF2809 domain-containing protein [Microbacterium]|uniref:ribosomal maturation YjgA family protein n=1 Tax=Microbacterium TaxID=33882 RepID=UPI0023DB33C8|nr:MULTISPECIES: DUF2809 domain-containing protein [Microbacterium]MDF2045730.1 DUF2809 domain-containing protein [Microbacterium sp. Kw_RZR3]MDQ1077288.1 hypothetical protein [Microbacterium sp. SORGH_AS_0969]MDQ1117532.1 hypothetical protein [Microbacterium testaceum]
MTLGRRRSAAAVALVVVVALGLVVARGLPDSDLSDISGDALYAVAVYTALVLVWPGARRGLLGVVAAAWSVGVEFLQLTGVPADLAGRFPPAALVLGSGFDPRDLAVYLLAAAIALTIDAGASALLLHRGDRRAGVGGSP